MKKILILSLALGLTYCEKAPEAPKAEAKAAVEAPKVEGTSVLGRTEVFEKRKVLCGSKRNLQMGQGLGEGLREIFLGIVLRHCLPPCVF